MVRLFFILFLFLSFVSCKQFYRAEPNDAIKYYKVGNYEGAEKVLLMMLKWRGDKSSNRDNWTYYRLGLIYARKGEAVKSVEMFETYLTKAGDIYPHNIVSHLRARLWLIAQYSEGESQNLKRAKALFDEVQEVVDQVYYGNRNHARSRLALEKEVDDPVIKIDLAHINIKFYHHKSRYSYYTNAKALLNELVKLPPSTFVGWEVEWYKQTKKLLDELETGRRKIANGDYLKEGYEGMMIKRTQGEKNEQ